MLTTYRFLLEVYVVLALVALVAFWIAGFAPSGSPTRLHATRSYVGSTLGSGAAAVAQILIDIAPEIWLLRAIPPLFGLLAVP